MQNYQELAARKRTTNHPIAVRCREGKNLNRFSGPSELCNLLPIAGVLCFLVLNPLRFFSFLYSRKLPFQVVSLFCRDWLLSTARRKCSMDMFAALPKKYSLKSAAVKFAFLPSSSQSFTFIFCLWKKGGQCRCRISPQNAMVWFQRLLSKASRTRQDTFLCFGSRNSPDVASLRSLALTEPDVSSLFNTFHYRQQFFSGLPIRTESTLALCMPSCADIFTSHTPSTDRPGLLTSPATRNWWCIVT